MNEFASTVERLFAAEFAPKQVRAIESGTSSFSHWQKVAATGFQDALVAETHGGAGLSLADVFEVLLACGAHCIPVPLSLTMMARAVLAKAEQELPNGPITVATVINENGSTIVCERVAYALTARWVLICMSNTCALLSIDDAKKVYSGVYGSLEASLEFPTSLTRAAQFPLQFDWRAAGALLFAAQIAGAMERVLVNTIRFANERSQFGRSIGKFQAIQQQISVMAEQVYAARMAAQLGCSSTDHCPNPLLAALAKARTSTAVVTVAAVAHAVHGAMGITEEYDLQLHTRRLHEWRLAFGSESYWNLEIGNSLLRNQTGSSVDFARSHLSPSIA